MRLPMKRLTEDPRVHSIDRDPNYGWFVWLATGWVAKDRTTTLIGSAKEIQLALRTVTQGEPD